MSDYHGDILAGSILRFAFPTSLNGAPITLAGTPSLACYKDGGTTESTAGLTLTVDFDGKTGLQLVAVDTSADGSFYAAGHEYSVVLAAGTINGVSEAGYVLGQFSVQNRYMRGTDSAALAATLATDYAAVLAAIAALNNLAAGAAMTLTAGERNSIATALLDLANGVETGVTLRQAHRTELAAAAGKLSGAATTTVKIRNQADDKDRITATVDADGNRTAVTLDLT